jgi:hypothetical protein
MNARVAASSGWPGERNTSWTIGGASCAGNGLTAARCKAASRGWRHIWHSPLPTVWLPQVHVRRDAGYDIGVSDAAARLCLDSVVDSRMMCSLLIYFAARPEIALPRRSWKDADENAIRCEGHVILANDLAIHKVILFDFETQIPG